MRIIAKINDKNFLIEATDDDIAKLYGKQGAYYLPEADKPKVGKKIPVGYVYNLWQGLSQYNNHVTSARQSLTGALKRLENADIPFVSTEE